MKKTMAILLALVLVGSFALRADPQDDLMGKVVRLSGSVNGMGVVLLYKAGSFIMLDEVDGSRQQKFNLINPDYQLDILADSREAYLQMLRDGLALNPVPARSVLSNLSEFAESARKKRIAAGTPILITGVVASFCGIYFMFVGSGHSFMDISTDSLGVGTLVCGLVFSGVGVLVLSSKSSTERNYDRIKKEKAKGEQGNKLTLNFGLVPRGFAMGVRYCFQ